MDIPCPVEAFNPEYPCALHAGHEKDSGCPDSEGMHDSGWKLSNGHQTRAVWTTDANGRFVFGTFYRED